MAHKELSKRPHASLASKFFTSCRALFPLIASCLAFWLFCFFLGRVPSFPSSSPSPHLKHTSGINPESNQGPAMNRTMPLEGFSSSSSHAWNPDCDYSTGRWVRDDRRKKPYDESCRDIFKGWNCLRNQKPNAAEINLWRWQPGKCDLPQLDAALILERFKDKSIGFVGDSLNRNMYVSLVCTLKQVSKEVKKWRPVGADKAITFLRHNLTLAYHRTNLLAHYGRWEAKAQGGPLESLGYKEGYRVDVDVPQNTWAQAPRFHDVLILNTGHWWWAPEKFDPVKSPMLFFRNGEPILPLKSSEEGLDLVLEHMLQYVEIEMPRTGLKFLRTQSPRHFEGGDWNQGGTCQRSEPLLLSKVDAFFALEGKGPNVEMGLANQHLRKAVEGTSIQLLDISYMSSFRADAHPSKSAGKLHEDCMHWCLPGVTDFWNDMLAVYLMKPSP